MASYLPVYCAACARASLSTASPNAQQVCSFCEGPARVVPGPVFGDGDWLAFSEIDDAVFEAGLNRDEVAALTEELQQLLERADSPQPAVQLMIQRIPSLERCRPALVNGPTRGARLLMTLLSARSRDLPLTAEGYRFSALQPNGVERE
jgi:hypothetical protein